MESETTDHKHDQWQLLKTAAVVAIALWSINLLFGLISLCAGDAGARLGDSFGIVNALFSSLAVAGALYAVVIQQREFREARQQAASSEAHQKDVATTQAFSAYVQCLASCAQLTFMKYTDTSARIEKKLNEQPPMPDLSKIPPSEHLNVTKQFEELLQKRMQNFTVELQVMQTFHETTNSLLVELSNALETIKSFPNIASKMSYSCDNTSK